MTTPAVDVRDVCFQYDQTEVLHNAAFALPYHSFTVIVGPNGGGKTTLLKLLLGLLQPWAGTLSVLGLPPALARARTGYVPQSHTCDNAFPVTVLDIVLMGRLAPHCSLHPSPADLAAAREALADVALDGLSDRPYASLSGGQRQRVLIARALASGSELLLLDEPTANIDPSTAEQLCLLFKQLTQRLTLVMVSHNLTAVTSQATHVLCVNRTTELHTIDQLSTNQPPPHASLTLLDHGNCCPIFADPETLLAGEHRGLKKAKG